MDRETLMQMSTPELDQMLQAELRKDTPDGDLVRLILNVLREREAGHNEEITPAAKAAWDKFANKDHGRAQRPRPTARNWVIKAASVVAVVCLLICVIPQEAKAESLWEKLARWTDSVFEFFSPEEASEVHAEYVFRTDNPGLQAVYDAVSDMGITEPVVPMWLPDGYELVECEKTSDLTKFGICASFSDEKNILVLKIDSYTDQIWQEYHKDEAKVIEYEMNGRTFYAMHNIDNWVVICKKGNIEWYLSIICNEDELKKIICSVYSIRED